MLAAERRARRLYEKTRRAEARDGLVYGPYLTERRSCSITTARGGACTKLRRPYVRPLRRPIVGKRGKVREFSRRSRTRLQQTLCAIPIAKVHGFMLFATLTYPEEYPGWQDWKRHLDRFGKRMRRRFKAAGFVWKLEPQNTRPAPHFHLIIVGAPFIAKEWLSSAWYESVGSGDPKHLVAGTNIQQVLSHRGVVSYAAKYTAKWQELPPSWQEGVGRWWGVVNREALGISWVWAPLSQPQFWQACRIVRALVGARQRRLSRSPPRAYSAGTWTVLKDWQALRLVRCVLDTPHKASSWEEIEDGWDRPDMPSRTEMSDYLYRRPQAAELARRCAAAYAGEAPNGAPQGSPR